MLTIKKLFTLVLPKNTAGREWRVNQALYCPEQTLVYTERKPLRNTRVDYMAILFGLYQQRYLQIYKETEVK